MPIIRESMLHDDAVAARAIQDGAVTADKIGAGAVTLAKIGANSVNAAKLINLDTAGANFGPAFECTVDIPNATGNTDITVPVKCEIVMAYALKAAANGGAGDTVQLKNGGGTAISNALDLNTSTDGQMVIASSLDPATRVLAAGATLRLAANSATNCACSVVIRFQSRA